MSDHKQADEARARGLFRGLRGYYLVLPDTRDMKDVITLIAAVREEAERADKQLWLADATEAFRNERDDAKLRAEQAEVERDMARKFAEEAAEKYNALLAESGGTWCAFCGAKYPQGTPRHGDGALADHIAFCPKHPMRTVEADLAAARAEVERLRKALEPIASCQSIVSGDVVDIVKRALTGGPR